MNKSQKKKKKPGRRFLLVGKDAPFQYQEAFKSLRTNLKFVVIQFSICLISACVLLRRIMEKVGFPPSKHRMKFAAFMVAYVITLYLVGLVLNNFWGNIVLIHFSAPLLTLGCLLIGSLCYFIRFYFYEHDRRLDSRV